MKESTPEKMREEEAAARRDEHTSWFASIEEAGLATKTSLSSTSLRDLVLHQEREGEEEQRRARLTRGVEETG